ncbi:MAG: histidinol-phosphate transaminase [Catonella sp.]|nr:histidinol-phosphate transaminase [Catonella sp.]MDY6357231.1 histidinol-phosphate transaminase [Catonella sp.]
MKKSLAKKIRRVIPYTPGEQPKKDNIIKLNTNENPYPPAPGVVDAIAGLEASPAKLRLYPNPDATPLKSALARHFGMGLVKDNFFTGVGSDDVLAMAFLTFFNSDTPVLFPDITYSFYEVWADLFDIKVKRKPLDENFRIDHKHYLKKKKLGGIVIANPNAPTGLAEPVEFIKEVALAHPECVVIVDEAYVDFGGESCVALVNELPNLLVVQTFSKSRSLAGLRIGYAIGNTELIKAMEDVRYSYNSYTMNLPAQAIGAAVLDDNRYFAETVEKIVETREDAKRRLAELGFTFPDSKTNFIFAKHKSKDAEYIFEELKKKNIYVRHFNGERVRDYLRITIGTPDQMEALYSALGLILR